MAPNALCSTASSDGRETVGTMQIASQPKMMDAVKTWTVRSIDRFSACTVGTGVVRVIDRHADCTLQKPLISTTEFSSETVGYFG